jgi:hypothetical protein
MPRDRDTPPAQIPRVDPDAWDTFPVLRETFLEIVSDPVANAALRQMADLQYETLLQYRRYWPDREEPYYYDNLRAALADLRHLQGYLQSLVTENLNCGKQFEGENIPWEPCLRLAERAVGTLRPLADEMERELDALQASALPSVPEQQ